MTYKYPVPELSPIHELIKLNLDGRSVSVKLLGRAMGQLNKIEQHSKWNHTFHDLPRETYILVLMKSDLEDMEEPYFPTVGKVTSKGFLEISIDYATPVAWTYTPKFSDFAE